MGQKSRWTLPQVLHPPTYRKFTVCVPNERFYIAAFQGLLVELTYSKNWQRDGTHTAAEVSRIWQTIIDGLQMGDCVPDCPVAISESDYEMSICEQLRFHNGKLQGLCCGEWTDITGQAGLVGGPTQQGSGGQTPAPGACTTYHAQFAASSQYLVPALVSAGDVLTFSNANGAGQDGTVSPWHCPNGQTFFANACVGSGGTSGGDPAPAIFHMRLVALINGVYYEADSGVVTVPGGVSNAQIIIQANDSTLSDNSGSYALDIEVCNNQATINSHTFDFAVGDGGFTIEANGGDPGGVYVLGAGWKPTVETGPSHWYELFISKTFASLEIVSITAIYSSVWTTNTEPGSFSLDTDGSGIFATKAPDQGSNISFGAVGDAPGSLKIKIDMNVGKTVSGHLSGEDLTLSKLIVTFYGPDPF